MDTGGMMCIPSFMTIGPDSQVILSLLPRQSEKLQCWYYWWQGFMKYAVELDSGGMLYIPVFKTIGSGIQVILSLLRR
jgi:hypothetical protein